MADTVAVNELRGLAKTARLESHLGLLHKVCYQRPALALDLLEPFRPRPAACGGPPVRCPGA